MWFVITPVVGAIFFALQAPIFPIFCRHRPLHKLCFFALLRRVISLPENSRSRLRLPIFAIPPACLAQSCVAGFDYEKSDAARAFRGHRVPSRERPLLHGRGDALQLLSVQVREERDALKEFDRACCHDEDYATLER